jgi:hypothetical protein
VGIVNSTVRISRVALWCGIVVTVLGALSNGLYFLYLPGQAAFPWINLVVPIAGLLIVLAGVWLAFAHPERYGGKWLGAVSAVICLVLAGGSTFGFLHARDLPKSDGVPRVGQKAPDFRLVDSNGETVSLTQLLSGSGQRSDSPKAVLLIFYRGYW